MWVGESGPHNVGRAELFIMHGAYEGFCNQLGERPLPANALGARLARRGIKVERRSKNRRIYVGVMLDGEGQL